MTIFIHGALGSLRWYLICLALGLLCIIVIYNYPTKNADSSSLPCRSDDFVGREKEVNDVIRLFDNKTSIVDIYGSPGFGKSTLAIHVGHHMLKKGFFVHYVNLDECPKDGVQQYIAERVRNSDNQQETVNFNKFLQWVKGRNFYDLILLDNCDEALQSQKGDLQSAVEKIVAQSQNFKFLITSREATSYIGRFEAYKLHELSKEAACDLLQRRIPSGIDSNLSQREELAELTGNVPLALQIIGSLLRLPTLASPAVDTVIEELKKEPISTLSPEEINEKNTINASFSLSYKYLNDEEKRIGQLLSNFPGSFDMEACVYIITQVLFQNKPRTDIIRNAVKVLVQRSLLEFDNEKNRYHFHNLIREYFFEKQKILALTLNKADLFINHFQMYFFGLLKSASDNYSSHSFKKSLATLDKERHNFLQLFKDLKSGSIRCDLKLVVSTLVSAIDGTLLMCRFSYTDMLHITESTIAYLKHEVSDYQLISTSAGWKESYLTLIYHLINFQKKVNSSEHALEVYDQFKGLVELTIDSPATIRILTRISELYLEIDYHNISAYYYTLVLQAHTNEMLTHCGGFLSYCSYVKYANYFRHVNEYEKAAHYYSLSLLLENHTTYIRIQSMFNLHQMYDKLNQQENANEMLEDIISMLPELSELPHNELFQKMEDMQNMISRLRTHGITESADLLVGIAAEVVFNMGTEVDIEQEKVLPIIQSFYGKGDYQKAVELGTHVLKRYKKDSQMLVQLQVIVGKAKLYYGNYSEGLKDMEMVIKSISPDTHYQEYQTCCFYLIPQLKYLNICYGHHISNIMNVIVDKAYKITYTIIKVITYLTFAQPLDVFPASNSDSPLTSYFPEITHVELSSSRKVAVLSDFHPLAEYLITMSSKVVITFSQNMWQNVINLWNMLCATLWYFLKFSTVRFIINVTSIIIRLYITTIILCFSFFFLWALTIQLLRGLHSTRRFSNLYLRCLSNVYLRYIIFILPGNYEQSSLPLTSFLFFLMVICILSLCYHKHDGISRHSFILYYYHILN